MKDPKTLLPLVANGFKSLGEKIASGAETLYKKYGAGPVKVLKTGFNKIGGAFKDLGVAFKQGFVVSRYIDLLTYLRAKGTNRLKFLLFGDPVCFFPPK